MSMKNSSSGHLKRAVLCLASNSASIYYKSVYHSGDWSLQHSMGYVTLILSKTRSYKHKSLYHTIKNQNLGNPRTLLP